MTRVNATLLKLFMATRNQLKHSAVHFLMFKSSTWLYDRYVIDAGNKVNSWIALRPRTFTHNLDSYHSWPWRKLNIIRIVISHAFYCFFEINDVIKIY